MSGRGLPAPIDAVAAADIRSACARDEGCDVRTLCQTLACCAARNPAVVLELARRIAGPEPVALVAHKRGES